MNPACWDFVTLLKHAINIHRVNCGCQFRDACGTVCVPTDRRRRIRLRKYDEISGSWLPRRTLMYYVFETTNKNKSRVPAVEC